MNYSRIWIIRLGSNKAFESVKQLKVSREYVSPCFDTDMNLYAVPGAPVEGLYLAMDKMADKMFCCQKEFNVFDISELSLIISVWRLQRTWDPIFCRPNVGQALKTVDQQQHWIHVFSMPR